MKGPRIPQPQTPHAYRVMISETLGHPPLTCVDSKSTSTVMGTSGQRSVEAGNHGGAQWALVSIIALLTTGAKRPQAV